MRVCWSSYDCHGSTLTYCRSISIACWIVVFSPQIAENFRRSSADGVSIVFIIIWLAGDVFNILGAVLQGVLPTMIILAVYYTLADIVLLLQCFYYRGLTLSDTPKKSQDRVDEVIAEAAPLLGEVHGGEGNGHTIAQREARRHSSHLTSRLRESVSQLDGTHLSPVTPLHDTAVAHHHSEDQFPNPRSTGKIVILNLFSIVLVCAAGAFGWWIGYYYKRQKQYDHEPEQRIPQDTIHFDLWGQIFGYLCAVLYLGSRLPQLLLNFRRKTTEGLSLLFFLFACIGNLTYVLSIFAYSPVCRMPVNCQPGESSAIYGRYILVNASWLLGSLGTLALDLAIFAQFFIYKNTP